MPKVPNKQALSCMIESEWKQIYLSKANFERDVLLTTDQEAIGSNPIGPTDLDFTTNSSAASR